MSDSNANLTEKISETLTNVFKKTKLFEKIDKIEIYISSFFIVSSIISLTSIYMNYYNIDRIKWLANKIEGSENKLKYNIEINRQQNLLYYNKLIKNVKNNTELLNNTQDKIIQKIDEFEFLLQNSKKELISESTSMSDFTSIKSVKLVKSVDSIDGWRENIIQEDDVKEMEDNELLNECYDSIPLNNIKKNTTSWLI